MITKGDGFTERDWPEPKPQKDAKGFTKGEWIVLQEQSHQPEIWADELIVAYCPLQTPMTKEERLANAHLIAAAVNACIKVNPNNPMAVADALPEVYGALVFAMAFCEAVEQGLVPIATRDMVRDIITKALAKTEGK